MKKSRFKAPYKPNGRTSFGRSIVGKVGVYLIKKNGEIVYVGHSTSDLYKTLYRHFQSWSDPTQKRVSYKSQLKRNKFSVRVILTTKSQAYRLEKYLVMKIRPKDNEVKIDLFSQPVGEVKKMKNVYDDYFGTPTNDAPF